METHVHKKPVKKNIKQWTKRQRIDRELRLITDATMHNV